jgi:dTDP-4-amino-4,6-dideoxygalactose transaminase
MIRIAKPAIDGEERAAVLAVLESGQLAAGPVVRRFEEEFAARVSKTSEAVAVANGTAALHVALLAHGVGPGDEVITTPFTFQATANMILACGARPVFVDVRDDGNIDPNLIEAALTTKTKAIMPVHLYGRLCDMSAICEIAQRRKLAIIEDAAQAHGAEIDGRRAGSFGTGCFSFYATKNLTSGEGGMITTDDVELAKRMRLLRAHGESERYLSTTLGFNYRLTEMAAALVLPQLNRLKELTAARRRNAAFLSSNLCGVVLPSASAEDPAMVWHQYTIRVPDGRDELQDWLANHEIEAAVYYPRVLPEHPLYKDLGYEARAFPVARRLTREVLSLPVHPGLSQGDLDQIVDAVNAWTTSRQPLTADQAGPG